MSTNASKRKRLSEGKPENAHDEDKHRIFTNWAKERGVQINGVKPARIPGRGLGLVATRNLRDGDQLLFIPEKAMFQPDPVALKREGLAQTSPQAQLAVSVLLAFNGPHRGLKVWEDTWPSRTDFEGSMPMCWPNPVRQYLPPPVHQPLERQLSDYDKDWNAASNLCRKNGFSEDDFKYYWMIVNSRSFHWKPRASIGGVMVMCPFIDYINHGPTGSSCRVSQTAKGYEVTADRNYGEHFYFFYDSINLLAFNFTFNGALLILHIPLRRCCLVYIGEHDPCSYTCGNGGLCNKY